LQNGKKQAEKGKQAENNESNAPQRM